MTWGIRTQTPRYNVISVRVTDEEMLFVKDLCKKRLNLRGANCQHNYLLRK